MEKTQTIKETGVASPTTEMQTAKKQYQTKKAIFRSYQVIWYLLGVVEVTLAIRIALKLLGGSTNSGFTQLIYTLSNPLASPFSGIVGTSSYSNNVLEWTSLIAMAIYAIATYGIMMAFQFVKPTDQEEVELAVDNQ